MQLAQVCYSTDRSNGCDVQGTNGRSSSILYGTRRKPHREIAVRYMQEEPYSTEDTQLQAKGSTSAAVLVHRMNNDNNHASGCAYIGTHLCQIFPRVMRNGVEDSEGCSRREKLSGEKVTASNFV